MNHEDVDLVEIILGHIINAMLIGTPIIMTYKTAREIKNFVLNRKKEKNQEIEEIVKVILPPELTNEAEEINIKNIATQSCKEEIVRFSKTLIENFKKEDLVIFYNNIKKLKVETRLNAYNDGVFIQTGKYIYMKNKIIVSEKHADVVIYHELFHMASYKMNGKTHCSGFLKQKLGKQSIFIGEGINEGYTELLSRRYFNANNGAYTIQVFFAEKLEQIVGKEKMEKLYLNANLEGLIEELQQYATIEEIEQFIYNLDSTLKIERTDLNEVEKEQMRICLIDINKFLIKCYTKKMCNEIKLTEKIELKRKMFNELNNNLNNYINSLPRIITKGNEPYIKIPYDGATKEYENIAIEILNSEFPIKEKNNTK